MGRAAERKGDSPRGDNAVIRIPRDFPVRPLRRGTVRKGRMTCGTCGMSWDDDKPTAWTPVPGGRCPFEYFHKEEK